MNLRPVLNLLLGTLVQNLSLNPLLPLRLATLSLSSFRSAISERFSLSRWTTLSLSAFCPSATPFRLREVYKPIVP